MILIKDFQHKTRCYYHEVDLLKFLRILISDGSSTMVCYRTACFFRSMKLGFIGWIFLEINKILSGCVIGRNAEFEEGFVIMHPAGVVINGAVKGGKNIVIESGVVIGAAHGGIPVHVPRLGNNILIGAGAKILGGIKIGNNVKIGANAVIVKDVPDGATVVGIPGKIVKIDA